MGWEPQSSSWQLARVRIAYIKVPRCSFVPYGLLPGLRTIYTREITVNGARALKNSNKPTLSVRFKVQCYVLIFRLFTSLNKSKFFRGRVLTSYSHLTRLCKEIVLSNFDFFFFVKLFETISHSKSLYLRI